MLKADGYDEAIIGWSESCGRPDIVVYDRQKCIGILMRDGMTHEDAEEYFCFNTLGAWVGEETPMFLTLCDAEGVDDHADECV